MPIFIVLGHARPGIKPVFRFSIRQSIHLATQRFNGFRVAIYIMLTIKSYIRHSRISLHDPCLLSQYCDVILQRREITEK